MKKRLFALQVGEAGIASRASIRVRGRVEERLGVKSGDTLVARERRHDATASSAAGLSSPQARHTRSVDELRLHAPGVRLVASIGCLLVATAVSACGGSTSTPKPSQSEERAVAGRFASALLRGDADSARALLVKPDKPALVVLVRQAAARWEKQDVSFRLPARHLGDNWTVSYTGMRTYRGGRFKTETGKLVVLIGASAAEARVSFFLLSHLRTRDSTHQDAELLPSKR